MWYTSLYLNNEALYVQNNAIHLGHHIGNDNTNNNIAIDCAIRDIVWQTNYILSKFSSCSSDVKMFMFHTYCSSYYGSPLWRLNSKYIDKLHVYVAWRNCVRKIWKISPRSHCCLLKHLCNTNGIECDLMTRFLSFYKSVYFSRN